MEITWRVTVGAGGRMGEKVQGIRSINWQVQNRQGEVKNSMGNGKAKELTCAIHGHELRWGNAGGRGGYRMEVNKREEKNGKTVIA